MATHCSTPHHTTPALTAMRSDTACSCDLSWKSLLTAWRLRTSDLAMTLTASCTEGRGGAGQGARRAVGGQAAPRGGGGSGSRRTAASLHPAHHLPLLGHLLNLHNQLLLLRLQAHALTVQLPNRPVQHPLVLAQQLCGGGGRMHTSVGFLSRRQDTQRTAATQREVEHKRVD